MEFLLDVDSYHEQMQHVPLQSSRCNVSVFRLIFAFRFYQLREERSASKRRSFPAARFRSTDKYLGIHIEVINPWFSRWCFCWDLLLCSLCSCNNFAGRSRHPWTMKYILITLHIAHRLMNRMGCICICMYNVFMNAYNDWTRWIMEVFCRPWQGWQRTNRHRSSTCFNTLAVNLKGFETIVSTSSWCFIWEVIEDVEAIYILYDIYICILACFVSEFIQVVIQKWSDCIQGPHVPPVAHALHISLGDSDVGELGKPSKNLLHQIAQDLNGHNLQCLFCSGCPDKQYVVWFHFLFKRILIHESPMVSMWYINWFTATDGINCYSSTSTGWTSKLALEGSGRWVEYMV